MVGLHVIEYIYFGFRGYGDSHGDSNGDSCGYGMGMGIEMPSPRQPWEIPTKNWRNRRLLTSDEDTKILRRFYEVRKKFCILGPWSVNGSKNNTQWLCRRYNRPHCWSYTTPACSRTACVYIAITWPNERRVCHRTICRPAWNKCLEQLSGVYKFV